MTSQIPQARNPHPHLAPTSYPGAISVTFPLGVSSRFPLVALLTGLGHVALPARHVQIRRPLQADSAWSFPDHSVQITTPSALLPAPNLLVSSASSAPVPWLIHCLRPSVSSSRPLLCGGRDLFTSDSQPRLVPGVSAQ